MVKKLHKYSTLIKLFVVQFRKVTQKWEIERQLDLFVDDN